MRDHGGNLDAARALHGGPADAWIDLSTGINPRPYPLPPLPGTAFSALPTTEEAAALRRIAARAWGARVLPVAAAGAQAAIQALPALAPPGKARVLGPTYNEHAAALRAAGWAVAEVDGPEALAGADLAVVVNPNNPDGRRHPPGALRALSGRVGLLVVDESFVDTEPGLSLLPGIGPEEGRIVVLRSFGKFYGLAGLRLGFAFSGEGLAGRLAERLGPWAVSGPAIAVGCAALPDRAWAEATRRRLAADAARLDACAARAGWQLVGGTPLFRLYDTPDAAAAQERLARARIWSRRFPWSAGWLRLGLPDGPAWPRLEAALS